MAKTCKLNPHSAMSLLNHLVKEQLRDVDVSNIGVVGQFAGDLSEVQRLGVSATHAFEPNQYFNEFKLEIKKPTNDSFLIFAQVNLPEYMGVAAYQANRASLISAFFLKQYSRLLVNLVNAISV